MPPSLRRAVAGSKTLWHVTFRENQPVLCRTEAGATQELGPVGLVDPAQWSEVTSLLVRLPGDGLLLREASYPQGAAGNLSVIIGHDAEKLFPFNRDAILTGYRVKSANAQTITVDVAALPRARVAETLETLRAVAPSLPLKLEVETQHGATIELFAGDDASARAAHNPSRKGMMLAAVAGAALLVIVSGGLMVGERMNASARLEAATDEAARLLPGLERRQGQGLRGAALRQSQEGPSVLETLVAATDALPDGTFLRTLSISEGDLLMAGQSDDPAPLLSLLRDEPLLTEAEFAQPVRRRDGQSRDDFEISAKIVGGGA